MTAPLPPQSGFLPAGAVRVLRAREERSMTARVEFQRKVRVEQPGGKDTEEWVTVAGLAAVRCNFLPVATPREVPTADTVAVLAEHELRIPHDTVGVTTDLRAVIAHKVPGLVSPVRLALTGAEKSAGPRIVQRWYGREVAA